jgi:hypothetical protein
VDRIAAQTLIGPPLLGSLHAAAMPQKDQLCGPFWGALALRSHGHDSYDGDDVDQDLVAVLARSSLADEDPRLSLPPHASPRLDYRLQLPTAPRPSLAGTSSQGLAEAVENVSRGELVALPIAGPWTESSVFELTALVNQLVPAATVVANGRTGLLWPTRPPPHALLDHLAGRPTDDLPSEWDVGHFFNLAALLSGPGGALVLIRDTYPTLGWNGYHLQPAGALAAALLRGDGREGGILVLCASDESEVLRKELERQSYDLRHWNNGTPAPG